MFLVHFFIIQVSQDNVKEKEDCFKVKVDQPGKINPFGLQVEFEDLRTTGGLCGFNRLVIYKGA